MILHDQHIHSNYSLDSNEALENYYKIASEKGIKYVITCEHYDFCTAIDHSTWAADYKSLIKEQKELLKKYPSITPLLGLEVGYRQDYLKEMNEIASKYPFDLIQLSLHDNGIVDYYYKESFEKDVEAELNKYFDLLAEGIDNFANFDVVSHIDYGFKTALLAKENIHISDYENKLVIIMKKIIEKGKALEINAKVQKTINDKEHILYILKLYKSLNGTKITVSSDAHDVTRYKEGFDYYLSLIKECGFDYVLYYIKRKEYKYYI